jgi:hypothetical protein
LLRRATGAGIPLDGSLINHDGEGKAGVRFGLLHHQLRCLVDVVAGAIPIDNDAINAAADHIVDLTRDLIGVGGAVAHVHMVRLAEPEEQMGVYLGGCAGVEQGVDIKLAHIARSAVAIRLRLKCISRAGVVRGLRSEGGGRHDVRRSGPTQT